jgi:hypothetical protein
MREITVLQAKELLSMAEITNLKRKKMRFKAAASASKKRMFIFCIFCFVLLCYAKYLFCVRQESHFNESAAINTSLLLSSQCVKTHFILFILSNIRVTVCCAVRVMRSVRSSSPDSPFDPLANLGLFISVQKVRIRSWIVPFM